MGFQGNTRVALFYLQNCVSKSSMPLFKHAVHLPEMKCLFTSVSVNEQQTTNNEQIPNWTNLNLLVFLHFRCQTWRKKREWAEANVNHGALAVPRWVWWVTAGAGVVKPASITDWATQKGGSTHFRDFRGWLWAQYYNTWWEKHGNMDPTIWHSQRGAGT